MRKMIVLGGVLMLAACGGNPNTAPNVSWGYGAGNGDPVPFSGPAPRYSFANGLGQDMPVPAGQMPTVTRGYGSEQNVGVTENMSPTSPTPNQQVASPAPTQQHPAITPPTSSHL